MVYAATEGGERAARAAAGRAVSGSWRRDGLTVVASPTFPIVLSRAASQNGTMLRTLRSRGTHGLAPCETILSVVEQERRQERTDLIVLQSQEHCTTRCTACTVMLAGVPTCDKDARMPRSLIPSPRTTFAVATHLKGSHDLDTTVGEMGRQGNGISGTPLSSGDKLFSFLR